MLSLLERSGLFDFVIVVMVVADSRLELMELV
jgi:hypothetical protein